MKNVAGRHLPAIANLLALEATVRLGSLTEAGNELYLTQSTISKQLSELEAFVGVPLLTRAKGAVAATPAGTQYLARLRRALTEIEDATLEVSSGQGRGGRLNLSVPVSLGNLWLLPRLLEFAKQQPDILLNLASKIGPVDLRASGLDAAVVCNTGPGVGEFGLRLMGLRMWPVCAPELLRPGEPLAETLERLPLLHLVTALEGWPSFCERMGTVTQQAFRGPRYTLLTMGLQAALNGLGIALLPDWVAGDELRAGRLAKVSESCFESRKAYHFICPQSLVDTPAVATLVQWLRAEVCEPGSD
jgi:LysR family glycine cleavage system transcriptional activator